VSTKRPARSATYPARITLLAAVLALAAAGGALADELSHTGANDYQNVTGDDPEDGRKRWDSLFSTGGYVFGKEPAGFLRSNLRLLPEKGRVLDLAMGEGRNAVFMASKGYEVDGVDFSNVALRKARKLARERSVKINAIEADLTRYAVKPDSYDVILDIDYLQRSLIPAIKRGLRKGGVVVFEGHTVEQLKNVGGQEIPRDFLLEKGELKTLFKDFQILMYRETNDGKDARASLIARRP
jgi:tellurite methyltransferase